MMRTVSRRGMLILLCIGLMLVAGQAFAASIYISPTGNDTTGDGSIGSPYRTLAKAGSVAVAGDTVYARGGTYSASHENLAAYSGAAGNPITFTNYPGEHAVFDGTGHTFTSGESILDLGNHVVVDGFEVKNNPAGSGIVAWEVHDVTISNCIVHEVWGAGISVHGDHIVAEGNEVYRAVLMNENGKHGGGGWSCGIVSQRGDNADASTNIAFRNNYVHDVWGEGINTYCTDGFTTEGNTVMNAYSVNFYLDNARNGVVRNNISFTTPEGEHRLKGALPQGIGMASERYRGWTPVDDENIQSYNNLIWRTSEGIRWWKDSAGYRNLKICHNTIIASERAGIQIDAGTNTSGNELQNNIVYGAYVNDDLSYWVTSNNDWPDGVPTIGSHPNSFAADPLFVNPVQSDIPNGFRLGGGSPCISAGASVGVTRDFFGTARDARPDLGFHEYADTSLHGDHKNGEK